MRERILCLIIGYAFGMLQTSYLYGRLKGVDIRTRGSGNAGTTNALRTLGPKAGLITLLGDVCKGIAAVLLTYALFHAKAPSLFPLLKVWTGLGVIIGHDFPFYMQFKGGKGIAATAGLVLAFGDPTLAVISIGLFLVLFFTTHYVSLCSLSLSASFFAVLLVKSLLGRYAMTGPRLFEMCALAFAILAMNTYRHRANVQRLLAGKERRTFLTHKSDQ